MKVSLRDWGINPSSTAEESEKFLLRVPYRDLGELTLEINNLVPDKQQLLGLVPPFEYHNLAFTFRCLSSVRDHFPEHTIYAVVPTWTATQFIRSVRAAGFRSFILPFLKNGAMEQLAQTVESSLDGCQVHVAGGDPQRANWTWSEEEV